MKVLATDGCEFRKWLHQKFSTQEKQRMQIILFTMFSLLFQPYTTKTDTYVDPDVMACNEPSH